MIKGKHDSAESNGTAAIDSEWVYANISDASMNARKIYFIYISVIFYCGLTVFGTTDLQIILNEKAHLPLVNLQVPLNGFFLAAPMLTLFIFIYFQLYLQRIKSLKDELYTKCDAVEKKRFYPWIVNIADAPEEGIVGKLQQVVVRISLWWMLPVILMVFPLWFAKAHKLYLSIGLTVLPIIGTLLVVFFSSRYKPMKMYEFISLFIFVSVFELFMALLIFRCVNVMHWDKEHVYRNEASLKHVLRRLSTVDLSYLTLSKKNLNDDTNFSWLRLNNPDLAGANLRSVILKNMDLTEMNFKFANLYRADLQDADLEGADLSGALLQHANFRNARLYKSRLINSDLTQAVLNDAYMPHADMQHAIISVAKLIGSKLLFADFTEAKITNTDFTGANLAGAKMVRIKSKGSIFKNAILNMVNFTGAELNNSIMDESKLEKAILKDCKLINVSFKNANLRNADFTGANLENADFNGAALNNAIFRNCNLRGANFNNADITGASFNSDSNR